MENYVIALDLGTSTTSIIAGLIDPREPYGIKVIHQETVPSMGIKRGSISNTGEAQKMINNLFLGAERKFKKSQQLKKWYIANISGTDYRSETQRYDINTSGQAINEIILNRLKEEARNRTNISIDEDLIRFVPTCYSLDSAPMIKDPIGFTANRTEGHFLAYIANKEVINNINQVMPKTAKLTKVYAAASAKSAILLSEEDRKNGVALVDLGAGTTNIAIAFKGSVQNEISIPFGANTITTDIARGMGINEFQAEHLKKVLGLEGEKESKSKDYRVKFQINDDIIECDLGKLDFIIRARAEEIISYVDSALMQSRNRGYVKNIILTGGGAELKGIEALFTEKTGIPTRKAMMPMTSIDATETLSQAIGMASIFARENRSLFIDKKDDGNATLFDQINEQDGSVAGQEQKQNTSTPDNKQAEQKEETSKKEKSNIFKKFMKNFDDMISDGPSFNEEKKD